MMSPLGCVEPSSTGKLMELHWNHLSSLRQSFLPPALYRVEMSTSDFKVT